MESPYKLSTHVYMVHLFVAKKSMVIGNMWPSNHLNFICHHLYVVAYRSPLTTHMVAFPIPYLYSFLVRKGVIKKENITNLTMVHKYFVLSWVLYSDEFGLLMVPIYSIMTLMKYIVYSLQCFSHLSHSLSLSHTHTHSYEVVKLMKDGMVCYPKFHTISTIWRKKEN